MNVSSQNRFLVVIIGVLFVVLIGLLVFRFVSVGTEIDPDSLSLTEEPSLETPSESEAAETEWPLMFTTMTHMEGSWDMAATDEGFFSRQAGLLRTAMDYAEMYDAVLTFETEIPFAEGMVNFNDNVFQEALDRGMGIGTHCDIGPQRRLSTEGIIQEFLERKQAVDVLVDANENLGCAGGGGRSDWYEGAVGAGFVYISGMVGFHYLAMPASLRPEGWSDQVILEEYYHHPAPVEDALRYYPFRVSDASFNEDTTGRLVVSAGDIGEVSSIGDLNGENGWNAACGQDCEVKQDDVDAIVEAIRNFDAIRDRSRPAKMQVYIPSQKYSDEGIELFFEALQELQEDGVIQWASQKEVYETFLAWEVAAL
ncbi:hypothetical protein CO174_00735 [Candidatus Uhrbacteria bacterium CG_4_9_14_3_um_filter_50_9]|uniref:Uncharacterized protein n=1 Tax=Candidatus Uhrbacteria bacterium CG_4_9_14_3_um_filter_50_9 TaxID=1975035 RepID=A0A2M7XE86_9BACT|nr:MAG: hypothetical protein CO174_00735 [Candidatus Uhrbacteria bacterium CG_4_9_14_3_um_filter_50_9]